MGKLPSSLRIRAAGALLAGMFGRSSWLARAMESTSSWPDPIPAVLEIDEIALAAIHAADRDLDAVVQDLLTCGEPADSHDPLPVSRSGEEAVEVYLRAGRISTCMMIGDLAYLEGAALYVHTVFPETVIAALPGRLATDIVDHPLLRGIRISAATSRENSYVSIYLDLRSQPLVMPKRG